MKKQLSNYPVWFDGTNINEAAFCEEFLHTHKILFANNAFFTPEFYHGQHDPYHFSCYPKLFPA